MAEKTEKMRGENGDAGCVSSEEITITSEDGFHARPAAKLAAAAKKFRSEIKLLRGGHSCNVKSVVSVMGMVIEKGQTVKLEACGDDAAEAIAALSPLLSGELDEHPAPKSVVPPKAESSPAQIDLKENQMRGIGASPGIAVGTAYLLTRREIVTSEQGESPETEKSRLDAALDQAKDRLHKLGEDVSARADASRGAIFEAHAELLGDPDLLKIAEKLIDEGKSAAYAWQRAAKEQEEKFAALPNEYLAERANDMADIGRMVLGFITGVKEESVEYPQDSIIIAEDLAPSDTAALDPARVVGFCTVKGGATSHVSILARSLGIPAVVGIDSAVLGIGMGEPVILDGGMGTLTVHPADEEMKKVRTRQTEQAARRAGQLAATSEDAVTRDGRRIDVAANISGCADAVKAASFYCDGVGLLRSEFLFQDRRDAPAEDEQAEAYREIARAIGDRKPLVVRTLDVGGDKPLPYIDQAPEGNPFLGVRGIRLCLDQTELFASQLRAIIKSAYFCKLHIMFPMVSTINELRRAKEILEEQRTKIGVVDIEIKVGIMVEVPSAAILARHFAKEVDFLSIGTNDLTQYTLAADRGNAKLSAIADGLDPSVLALIGETVSGAAGSGCWVGVCGGIASDPLAVPVLVGLGVDELSVSVPAIPAIKARVRELSYDECRRAAEDVLDLASAAEVRAYLRERFNAD